MLDVSLSVGEIAWGECVEGKEETASKHQDAGRGGARKGSLERGARAAAQISNRETEKDSLEKGRLPGGVRGTRKGRSHLDGPGPDWRSEAGCGESGGSFLTEPLR